ncbi:hypothetical protein AVEN_9248-1 [Araneus ventricosus]|uniref:Uncharacterized protein n=1 Tax=Araneus ventricosus TaxID=182803 RepID=A0A4Y2N0G5_ARAVE|nr:hypothetical protein AVEN_9248-1 [Araneus ventricosus]
MKTLFAATIRKTAGYRLITGIKSSSVNEEAICSYSAQNGRLSSDHRSQVCRVEMKIQHYVNRKFQGPENKFSNSQPIRNQNVPISQIPTYQEAARML